MDRARQARKDWLASNAVQDGCLEESGEAYAELDVLLSSGGPLPTDWAIRADEGTRSADEVPLPEDGLPRRHGTEYHLQQALKGIAALRHELGEYSLKMSGLASENARLRAELDVHAGRNVLLCLDRDVQAAMRVSVLEPDGTILRTTDTGIEYELDGRLWARRSSLASRERT